MNNYGARKSLKDWNVEVVDVFLIDRCYVGLNLSGFGDRVADVNPDGAINIVKALLIDGGTLDSYRVFRAERHLRRKYIRITENQPGWRDRRKEVIESIKRMLLHSVILGKYLKKS